jgi:hypothetical protein
MLFCDIFHAKFVNIKMSKRKCVFNGTIRKEFQFPKSVDVNHITREHSY